MGSVISEKQRCRKSLLEPRKQKAEEREEKNHRLGKDRLIICLIYIHTIYKKLKELPETDFFKKWVKDPNPHFSKGDTQMANRDVKKNSLSLIIKVNFNHSDVSLDTF